MFNQDRFRQEFEHPFLIPDSSFLIELEVLMSLNCIGLTKAYGDNTVLDGFTHAFPEGRVSCVLGRSGCD